MTVHKTKNKKYELVAPDGGWGYMICLAVILNMITISSFVNCFGMVFKELFIELKMDSTSITLFNGVNSFIISISVESNDSLIDISRGMTFVSLWIQFVAFVIAIFVSIALSEVTIGIEFDAPTWFMTSSLLKCMSARQLGLIATSVLNVGVLGTVFAKSKFHFFFCQGFLQSLGHGVIFNLSCTMLNIYFVKRRYLAVSFTQTVVATTAFLTPLFVKWTTETYGYRGTFLLISGISMHSFFAMAVMHPVSWHMRKVEVPEDKEEDAKLLNNDKTYITTKEDFTSSIKSENGTENLEENINSDEHKTKIQRSRLKKVIYYIVDVSLIKTYLVSNACIGTALALFTEMTYTLMVPQALYFMGWNEHQVAWAVSLNSLGDLATRTLLICMSSAVARIGSHEIFVVGLAIAFTSRIGMLWTDNRIAMTTFMTIMGISRCFIMVLMPLVVADAVVLEKYSAAMGLFFLMFGLFNLFVGPIIGAVRDLTDSYTTAFYILTSFYAIVLISWSIELLYKKTKHKRQPKADISSKP